MHPAIARVHGGAPPGYTDFSAPLNPLPHPAWLAEAVEWCTRRGAHHRYPPHDLSDLHEAIRALTGRPDAHVFAYNGSAGVLALLPLALKAPNILVVEPNFGDHHIQAPAAGARLHTPTARPSTRDPVLQANWDEIAAQASQLERPLIIVSNPNNPTGQEIPRHALKALEDAAQDSRGLLVVDEAFQPLSTVQPYKPRTTHAATLWTPTKATGAPGLRLGALLTHDEKLWAHLEALRQPWPVDSITHCTYTRIAEQHPKALQRHARAAQQAAARWLHPLKTILEAAGHQVHPTTTIYALTRHPHTPHPQLDAILERHRIRVRDASTYKGLDETYSRITIQPPPLQEKLAHALHAEPLG